MPSRGWIIGVWALAVVGSTVACSSAPLQSPSPTPAASAGPSQSAAPGPPSTASTAPSVPATEPVTASPSSGAATEPPASASPAPTPTVAPATDEPELPAFAWRRDGGDPGLGELGLLKSSAAANGRFVVIGMDINYDGWHVWTSGDGTGWQEAGLPELEDAQLFDVAPGGPGFVLSAGEGNFEDLGGVVLLSTDGRTWEPVLDPDLDGFSMLATGAAGDGLVGVGEDAESENQILFVSGDGRDWRPAPKPEGLGRVLDMVPNGDQLVALAAESSPDSACARQLGLWQTADGEAWTKLATLPDSSGSDCSNHGLLAVGERGWVVVAQLEPGDLTSRAAAWYSADGTNWQRATNPPSEATDVYAAPGGFISVGHLYPAGCAIYEGDAWGQTWTSADGQAWQLMPDEDWLHREVDLLRRLGRTLIGIGIDWTDSPNGAIWTANLDEVALGGQTSQPNPEPTPDEGCGA